MNVLRQRKPAQSRGILVGCQGTEFSEEGSSLCPVHALASLALVLHGSQGIVLLFRQGDECPLQKGPEDLQSSGENKNE